MTPLELRATPRRPPTPAARLKILGISPLDKDATASLVEDGRILFAAGEERFSRVKQHAGFPEQAIEAALAATGTSPDEIDVVAYPFLTWDKETALIERGMRREREFHARLPRARRSQARARARRERACPRARTPIARAREPNQTQGEGLREGALLPPRRRRAPLVSRTDRAARVARVGASARARTTGAGRASSRPASRSSACARKLERGEHHLSHAANAYLASGFERALVVTLDGYGSGLAGSVSLGEGGALKRLHGLRFPHSLGSFYEMVTSSLGFHPDRHAGKIVGLAAYGDPEVLAEVLLGRVERRPATSACSRT